jgi:hypothetical protein
VTVSVTAWWTANSAHVSSTSPGQHLGIEPAEDEPGVTRSGCPAPNRIRVAAIDLYSPRIGGQVGSTAAASRNHFAPVEDLGLIQADGMIRGQIKFCPRECPFRYPRFVFERKENGYE